MHGIQVYKFLTTHSSQKWYPLRNIKIIETIVWYQQEAITKEALRNLIFKNLQENVSNRFAGWLCHKIHLRIRYCINLCSHWAIWISPVTWASKTYTLHGFIIIIHIIRVHNHVWGNLQEKIQLDRIRHRMYMYIQHYQIHERQRCRSIHCMVSILSLEYTVMWRNLQNKI